MTLKKLPLLFRESAVLFLAVGGGIVLGLLIHGFDSPSDALPPLPPPSPVKVAARIEPSPSSSFIASREPSAISASAGQKDALVKAEPSEAIRTPVGPMSAPTLPGGSLLGQASPSGQVSPSLARMVYRDGAGGILPAVLADPPEGLALTPEQTARFNKMAEEFVAAVGGGNQDPADPTYKRRWQEAQWLSDQEFRAYFGNQVFAEMQKQAYLQTRRGPISR